MSGIIAGADLAASATFPAATAATAGFAAHQAATAPGRRAGTRPTQSQQFLADYRTPIIGSTVASHVAHHQYLSKVKNVTSRRTYGVAGAAWAVAYVGVLSATTIAEAKVQKSTCPVELNKR